MPAKNRQRANADGTLGRESLAREKCKPGATTLWRTEFNYTPGMTDTLMDGRGELVDELWQYLAATFCSPPRDFLNRGAASVLRQLNHG